jgi:hypothetical protein
LHLYKHRYDETWEQHRCCVVRMFVAKLADTTNGGDQQYTLTHLNKTNKQRHG